MSVRYFCDQFLEEARKHANSVKLESTLHSYEKTTAAAGTDKGKRSWKNTLFFWRKSAKKENKSHEGMPTRAANGSAASNRRTGRPVSGPLPRSYKDRAGTGHRVSRPLSGPLAGCFTPTRAEETEIPYMSVGTQRHSNGVKPFGPIYRVT